MRVEVGKGHGGIDSEENIMKGGMQEPNCGQHAGLMFTVHAVEGWTFGIRHKASCYRESGMAAWHIRWMKCGYRNSRAAASFHQIHQPRAGKKS